MNRLENGKIPGSPRSIEYTKFPNLQDISKTPLLLEERKKLEALNNIAGIGEFFSTVNKNAAEISKRFIPSVDKEKANKVLDNSDFSGTSPTSREYDGLLKVALTKASTEREIIKSVVGKNSKEKKDSLDLMAMAPKRCHQSSGSEIERIR